MITDVVAGLITNEDKFMICQRPKHQSHPLLWEFVGGKIEKGETPEQALIRECKEELDILVSVGKIFMEVIHEYPQKTIRLKLYHAEIVQGEPKKIEPADIKWITCDQIDDFDFCPADIVILDKIKKCYANGLFPRQSY